MINDILLEKIQLLEKYNDKINHFIIQKSWVFGPHIKILYTVKNDEEIVEFENDFSDAWTAALEKYRKIEIDVDYELQKKIADRVSQIEDYKGEYLPLRKHLNIHTLHYLTLT